MSTRRFFWTIFFGLLFVFAGSVVWYTRNVLKASPPSEVALKALETTAQIQVQKNRYGWSFTPQKVKAGFVFYPGGLVDPRAYAPLMQKIASGGYKVALLEVPFNLAVSAQGRARQPIADDPKLKWAVGGHSLGGVVASNFASSNPDGKAVVMWAAYPQNDLSSRDIPTLALFGSNDGLVTAEKIQANRAKYPKGTTQHTIAGLNHAGFGSYGPQRGDKAASITPEQGWDQITQRTIQFLDQTIGAP